MTHKPTRDDKQRLEALYREHGETEPDAGLDWRIRARAHREARSGRLPRPGHWLGGAAVAASLFVVVSLVTQISPPQAEFPESATPRSEVTVQEAAQPAVPRSSASSVVAERRRAPVENDRAAADAFEPAPPPPMLSRSEPDGEPERSAGELIEQERTRTLQRLAEERVPLDPELGFSEARALPEADPDQDMERRIWLIEQLLAVGNIERARVEIEAFQERYPDRDLPQSLLDGLAPKSRGSSNGN